MQKFQPRKRLTVEGQGNDGNIRSQARVRPFLFLALGGCYEPSPPQTLVENHKTANWSLQQGDEGKQRWRSGESTLLPPMWSGPGTYERMPYASWVCSWFSPQGSLRVRRFFPLLKNQHFQIPIRSGHSRTRFDQSAQWVNKLQIVFIYEEVIKRKKRKKIFKQIYIFCFIPLFTFWWPWRLIILYKLP